jgi:oxygen-independent coproporphyrinogen III oxidase
MAGLYLHIPFCRRKCPYCDFYSLENHAEQLAAYPGHLKQHLAWAIDRGWHQIIDSIYFGGGTPSLLPPAAIGAILDTVARRYALADAVEITLEANPGTVTRESLTGYRTAGINRLSLGLQSTSDPMLATLGRLHDRATGIAAYRAARSAGFDNISLDLMFALPGQTTSALDEDLQAFLSLNPEHLSCYGLTAEPQTPLQTQIKAGELLLPDAEAYADAYLEIHQRLTAAGYRHYEIANYARPGFASRHNRGYWQRQPCLGIGAGAHSFFADNWGSRWQVADDLDAFVAALASHREPMTCLETFDRQSALRETIYLALRTADGLDAALLEERFACRFAVEFAPAIRAARPWLQEVDGHWSLTPAGWLLYDRLIVPFL